MSKHPLQFIELPRRDPEKQVAEVRIKHFDEIYESYDGAEAASQAVRSSLCSTSRVPFLFTRREVERVLSVQCV